MPLRSALALVGLFLRSRRSPDVLLPRGLNSARGVGDQRFLVSRFVLDEGWRWWSACWQCEETSGSGWAPLARFQRALRARDEVMADVLRGDGGRALDREVLYHFDALMVWLSSALDGVAQVVSVAHQLGGHPYGIGWPRTSWRKRLRTCAPTLWDMTEHGQPERAVVDLVASFRNTVHGDPITGVTHLGGLRQRTERGMVQLPADATARAATACELLGGPKAWGFEGELTAPRFGLWDPYLVVQMIVPFVARTLNAMMRATEVEALPGVDAGRLMEGPGEDWFFDDDIARRLLLLHGVGRSSSGPR